MHHTSLTTPHQKTCICRAITQHTTADILSLQPFRCSCAASVLGMQLKADNTKFKCKFCSAALIITMTAELLHNLAPRADNLVPCRERVGSHTPGCSLSSPSVPPCWTPAGHIHTTAGFSSNKTMCQHNPCSRIAKRIGQLQQTWLLALVHTASFCVPLKPFPHTHTLCPPSPPPSPPHSP
jgi:hypothetical protein